MTDDPEPRTPFVLIGILLVSVTIFFFVVLLWASPSRSTEYSMVSRSNIEYCDLYSKRAASTVVGIVEAYGDCIRILPTRLPLPEPQGTVPAAAKPSDEEWRRQCRAEYSTWDEETGTVVRRGNPERVKCPCMGEVQCVY